MTVTPATLRGWPLPAPGSDKEARGQVLVLGGTDSTGGAVLLSGEAALRAGAGKLAMLTVHATAGALGLAVPEAQVLGLDSESGNVAPTAADGVVEQAQSADVLLVGPGFSDPGASVALLERVLPRLQSPLVVDALASAYLTENPEGLHHLDGRAVVTMNPNELALTAGLDADDVTGSPLAGARTVAERSRVVVVCGGTSKHVVTPAGESWVVQGGGPGLGVSGSGDVQAGIIAGLLARGADPAQAAVWGAYLHARSGERLAAAIGQVGYLARELPPQVPAVLAELG